MAKQTPRPSSRKAPDPSDVYERSHPEHEAGMGRLDNNDDATPVDHPDQAGAAVTNQQDPRQQLNAQDVVDGRASESPEESVAQPGVGKGGTP
jgi:hypothetical protein